MVLSLNWSVCLLPWVLGGLLLLGVGLPRQPHPPAAHPATALVTALPEATRTRSAQGVFYRHRLPITIPTTPVWLASSADGTGALCTDDQATLTFRATEPTRPPYQWQHHFATADGLRIQCLPPQDLSAHLAPGSYEVEIVLDDLHPPAYGTRAYYLVFPAPPAAPLSLTPTMLPDAGPSPVATVAPLRPTATEALTPTRTVTPTLLPTPTVSLPTASPVSAVVPSAVPPRPPADETISYIRGFFFDADPSAVWWGGLALLGLSGLALLVGWHQRRMRPRPPLLRGVVDLFDTDSHEARTVLLAVYGNGAVLTRDPLAVGARKPAPPQGQVIGWLTATAAGVQLQTEPATSAAPLLLAPDGQTTYLLAAGAVTLHYRHV